MGYSFQDVKGQVLVDAKETNVTNALAGKVAGLQVIKGGFGAASSSKINLRGFNSLKGDNQPLIVVDGVPLSNSAGSKAKQNDGYFNNDFWNPDLDMRNGLADINADDIESISVLKGGAASALYGSRGGNGVILITTKTGKIWKFSVPPLASVPPEYNFVISFKAAASSAALGLDGKNTIPKFLLGSALNITGCCLM